MYLYFFRRGSDIISRTSIPSVRNWREGACLITKRSTAGFEINFLHLEYLDPRSVHIRAVVKPDGVAHLVAQQGTPLLCDAVGYLSPSENKHAESEALPFQNKEQRNDLAARGLTETAATRRGCVTPITFPSAAHPASRRY